MKVVTSSPATVESILHQLQLVQSQRRFRMVTEGLEPSVTAIKTYQRQRFMHTYADLLTHDRFGGAARFFLDELYGPRDFSERDAQFARVVPALVRLFPQDIVNTVQTLVELHALSEVLDTAMGQALGTRSANASHYVAAWQLVGREAERQAQIEMTVRLGRALDRLTHKPFLRHSLRMMRGPARVAGLHQLQDLLECGFDTFHAMKGADDFLNTVARRETSLADLLSKEPLDASGHLINHGPVMMGHYLP